MSNRRAFLQSAAAAFTTSLFTGNVRGANDRVAGAFIGVGMMGSENLSVALRQGVEVRAVCDVYQPHLERAGAAVVKAGGKAKEVRDFREVIADDSIDFVCVSTPDHWHAYITVEACKAGRDVYVEKPVCAALNEGAAMVKAARKYDRVVQAGTWQRSGQHFQKACEIVRSGELGRIAFARAWIHTHEPRAGVGSPADSAPPAGLDWDLWLGPAPERAYNRNRFGPLTDGPSSFRWYWDYAGGPLSDSGVHMIDILQMAVDEVMPESVVASGGNYWFEDDRETPDTLQVGYEYPDFLGSWEHRSNSAGEDKSFSMGLTFHGDRGTLYVDRARYEVTPEKGSDLVPSEMRRVEDPHPLHWANFLDCVRTRKRPNSDVETCVRSSISCLLANASYRSKMRLEWDDATQTVPQQAARSYLYREYRAPWKLEVG
ncbi:MAG: Gfo/Idh/MocA family oxidoreductase [Acidobacteria bacterium]|nr:Gfo/Idh/MocA family oxidoreductase [Acidobacteriota bacterium]